jgi:hypothetical protein
MAAEATTMSVDDFLASQSEQGHDFLATVEAVPDDPGVVKLTPWLPLVGCLCQYLLDIPKDRIESLEPTENRHTCCGKVLRVARVQFREGARIGLDQLFEQISRSANSPSASEVPSGMPDLATLAFLRQGDVTGFPTTSSTAQLSGKDAGCLADCYKTQGACLAACRFGAGTLGGYAACAAGCFAFGYACARNCYPLFPQGTIPNQYQI